MTEYRFDSWRFNPDSGTLSDGTQVTRLRPQTSLVLECLIEHSPRIATREEIRERLWPGNTIVDFDTGINSCIKQIRQALGEKASSPRYLHTVPKRGFRWRTAPPAQPESLIRINGPWQRWWLPALIISILVTAVATQWPVVTPSRPAVVVVPFDAPGASSAELVSRIHVELIHALGVDSEVRVISRRSILATVDGSRTAAQLGKRFDARLVVDGSVRPIAGGHMIAVSLVDASTDQFVWGELIEVTSAEPDSGIARLRMGCLEAVAAFFDPPYPSP